MQPGELRGHDLILQALAQLPAAIHWQVVGDGDQRPQLEAEAMALGLMSRVEFSGSLNDQGCGRLSMTAASL